MKTRGRALFVGSFLISRILAQDGIEDSIFSAKLGTGFSGTVEVVKLQDDGKILAGGWFNSCNGSVSDKIARLNSDGSIDTTFKSRGFKGNPATPNYLWIKALSVQKDGKILTGGLFYEYNNTSVGRFIRLFPNGELDTAFGKVKITAGSIYALEVQDDGKILVGGSFQGAIIRLNPDGSQDTTFHPSIWDGQVYSIAVLPGGKLLVGGWFSSMYGHTNNITRLHPNGALDSTFKKQYVPGLTCGVFNDGTGTNGPVTSLACQKDGKYLIAGAFSAFNGYPRWRIARINADGSADEAFESPQVNTDEMATSLVLQPDEKIIVGGYFSKFYGRPKSAIARILPGSPLDETFNENGSGFNSFVTSLALQKDGKLLAGGYFTTYNGSKAGRLVRIDVRSFLYAGIPKTKTESQLLIYPNPTNGDFTIQTGANEAATVIIYNLAGEKILSKSLTGTGDARIRLATQGIYIARITIGEQTVSNKIVVE